jgi:hypothetical protein
VTFFNGWVGVAKMKFMGVGSELSAEEMVATSSGVVARYTDNANVFPVMC